MWRRAVLSGSVVLCALSAMATADDPRISIGWAKDPWNDPQRTRRPGGPRPALPPAHRYRGDVKEYLIPSGPGRCYTGIVIVPCSDYGTLRLRFNDGRCEFPIAVQGGQTFVLPFANGWRPDCHATIAGDLCDGDFVAWAITDRGPVQLELCR